MLNESDRDAALQSGGYCAAWISASEAVDIEADAEALPAGNQPLLMCCG